MAWLARGLASPGDIVAAVNHPGNNALEPHTAEGFLLWWQRAKDRSAVLDFTLRDARFGGAIDRRKLCSDASGVARDALHARTPDLAVEFFRASFGTN